MKKQASLIEGLLALQGKKPINYSERAKKSWETRRRIHYRKGWENTKIVSQKVQDAGSQGKE
jgi:hypothetical protein